MNNIKKAKQIFNEDPGGKKKFFWVLLVLALIVGIWIGVQGANQGVLTLSTSAQGLANQDGDIKVRIRAIDAANISESLYTIDQTGTVKDGILKLRWKLPETAKKKSAYLEICAKDTSAGPSNTVKEACSEDSGGVSYNKISCPYYVSANSTGISGQLSGWNKLDDSQKVGCSDEKGFGRVSGVKALVKANSAGIQIDGGGILIASGGKIKATSIEEFIKTALAQQEQSVVYINTNTTVTGEQGADGANGADGTSGIATVSGGGLVLTGTNLSLDTSCSAGELLKWDGAVWACDTDGGGGGGVTSIGAIDSQSKSANGSVISGTTLYMQSADATYPGLVSTGTQTFAGNKTFTGNVTANGTFLHQNSSDSTGAFLVNKSSGEQLIKFDTATTENLLTNGSFESNTTGWTAKGSASISQTSSQKYLGSDSMQVTTTAAANDGAKYNYALASQKTYSITLYAKSSLTHALVSTISIGRTENGSTETDCATSQTINASGWSRITCVFHTGNTSGTNYIYVKQSDATARTIYLDSVELQDATNMIGNYDLETDDTDWVGYNSASISHNAVEANTGTGSLQIDTSGTGAQEGAAYYPTGGFQPNTTYTASAWVKLDSGSTSPTSVSLVRLANTTDPITGTSCQSQSLTAGTWTKFTCSFTTINTTYSNGYIALLQASNLSSPVTFYIDTIGLAVTKYNTSDIGRISLNGAIDSPLTIAGQNSTNALLVQGSGQSGTPTFVVDTTNSYVGIGTASPTRSLEVNGKVLFKATNTDTDTFQIQNTATTNNVAFNVAASTRTVTVGTSTSTANSTLNVYGTGLVKTMTSGGSASAFSVQDSANANVLTVSTSTGNKLVYVGEGGIDAKFQIINTSSSAVLDIDTATTGSFIAGFDNFHIQNSTGADMIFADGTNNRIIFGDSDDTSSANTALLVVDSASTANLPAGVNGGLVYDSQVNKFKIYEGGAYKTLCNTTDLGCAASTSIGTIDSQTKSSDGAVISSNSLVMQTADATYPGLVSTGTQTFAGAKTFSGNLVGNGTVSFQNSSNSNDAFNIRNAAGTGLLIADTSSSILRAGVKATSASASLSASTVNSSGSIGASPSVATGTDGLPIISYYDSTNSALVVTKCGNAACSSGNTTTQVDNSGSIGAQSSIAISTDGLPVISYYDSTNSALVVTKCGNAACSSGNTTTQVDNSAAVGSQGSIAIGTDGLPIISYYDTTNTALRVTKCGNAACSSGNTTTQVDNSAAVGQSTSIAIGTDGLPVISYYDATNSALRVTKCGDTACSSGNTSTEVDNTTSVGSFTSLAIGTDGLPVMSYYDADNLSVKVTKCGNAACSSGNTSTEIVNYYSGGYSSIAIGTDGLPVIAFYYNDTGLDFALSTVKCSNAACTAVGSINMVDHVAYTDNVGQYVNIAIGSDGLPIIAYYDATNTNLKFTKCVDAACAGSSGNSFSGGISLGSVASPFQSIYFDTLNLGKEGARLSLDHDGTFIANGLTTKSDGTALINIGNAAGAFSINSSSSANLVRVQNDSTQGFNQAQLIIGAGDANNPEGLARDSLYVFGRINTSWNQQWADCLTNAGTVTTAGSTAYVAAFNRSANAQIAHAGAVSGVSGVCRLSIGGTPASTDTGYFGSNGPVTERSLNPVFEARVLGAAVSDQRALAGFTDITQTTAINSDTNQSANEVFFRKQATSSFWETVTRSASGTEQINTFAATVNAWHRLRIEVDDIKAEVRFYVDGTLVATHTTLPDASTALGYAIANNISSGTSRDLDVDYLRIWSDDPPESVAPANITQNDGLATNNVAQTPTTAEAAPTVEDNGNDALLKRIKSLESNVNEIEQYDGILTTENLGDAAGNKAIFIADAEFRKQVQFSAEALFKASVNIDGTLNANGRVVASNNTGTVTVRPGQTEIQVLFAKSLAGKPNVFLSTEDLNIKVVAKERTKDGFIIKLSEPSTADLDVQWFAVEKQ